MNFNKKTGILLILLAIPVFIWLFLKLFGQNRFEVPVFYEEGVKVTGCSNSSQPHVIPPFSLLGLAQKTTDEELLNQLTIVYFFAYPCEAQCEEVMENLAKIQDIFESQPLIQIWAIGEAAVAASGLEQLANKYQSRQAQWKFMTGNEQAIETLKQCGFVLEGDNPSIVLIDGDKRIRGYYTGTDSEEIDRLIVEIRILLRNLRQ